VSSPWTVLYSLAMLCKRGVGGSSPPVPPAKRAGLRRTEKRNDGPSWSDAVVEGPGQAVRPWPL